MTSPKFPLNMASLRKKGSKASNKFVQKASPTFTCDNQITSPDSNELLVTNGHLRAKYFSHRMAHPTWPDPSSIFGFDPDSMSAQALAAENNTLLDLLYESTSVVEPHDSSCASPQIEQFHDTNIKNGGVSCITSVFYPQSNAYSVAQVHTVVPNAKRSNVNSLFKGNTDQVGKINYKSQNLQAVEDNVQSMHIQFASAGSSPDATMLPPVPTDSDVQLMQGLLRAKLEELRQELISAQEENKTLHSLLNTPQTLSVDVEEVNTVQPLSAETLVNHDICRYVRSIGSEGLSSSTALNLGTGSNNCSAVYQGSQLAEELQATPLPKIPCVAVCHNPELAHIQASDFQTQSTMVAYTDSVTTVGLGPALDTAAETEVDVKADVENDVTSGFTLPSANSDQYEQSETVQISCSDGLIPQYTEPKNRQAIPELLIVNLPLSEAKTEEWTIDEILINRDFTMVIPLVDFDFYKEKDSESPTKERDCKGTAQSLVTGAKESTALKVPFIPEPPMGLSTSETSVCPPTTIHSSMIQSTALPSSLAHLSSTNEPLPCLPFTQEPVPKTWTCLYPATEIASACMPSASRFPLACLSSATVTHPADHPSALEPPVVHQKSMSSVPEYTEYLPSVHETPVSCLASLPISEVYLSTPSDPAVFSSAPAIPPESQPFTVDERLACLSFASGGAPECLPFPQDDSPNCFTLASEPPKNAASEFETFASSRFRVIKLDQVVSQNHSLGCAQGVVQTGVLPTGLVQQNSAKKHQLGASSQRKGMTAAVQDVSVIAPSASVPEIPSTVSITPISMPNVPAVVSNVQSNLNHFQPQAFSQMDDRKRSEPLPQPPPSLMAEHEHFLKPATSLPPACPLSAERLTELLPLSKASCTSLPPSSKTYKGPLPVTELPGPFNFASGLASPSCLSSNHESLPHQKPLIPAVSLPKTKHSYHGSPSAFAHKPPFPSVPPPKKKHSHHGKKMSRAGGGHPKTAVGGGILSRLAPFAPVPTAWGHDLGFIPYWTFPPNLMLQCCDELGALNPYFPSYFPSGSIPGFWQPACFFNQMTMLPRMPGPLLHLHPCNTRLGGG